MITQSSPYQFSNRAEDYLLVTTLVIKFSILKHHSMVLPPYLYIY